MLQHVLKGWQHAVWMCKQKAYMPNGIVLHLYPTGQEGK